MRTKILKTLVLTLLVMVASTVPAFAKDTSAPVTLSGRILDPLGSGAADQWVTLTSEDGALVYSVQSGPSGEYTFTDLPASSYFIRVSNIQFARNIPPRYWLSTHNPIPLQASTTLDIPLPFIPLTVEVKHPDSTPLDGVELFTNRPYNPELFLAAFPAHGKSQYIETEPGVTDLDGAALLWLFPTVDGQTYEITAQPSDESGFGAKIVRGITLTAPKTITIVMDPPQNLTGTVFYPAGTPLANQVVSVTPKDTGSTAYPPAITRPSGSFVFSVSPGNYNFRVEKDGASTDTPTSYWIETQDFPVAILPDQKTDLSIVVPFEEVALTVLDQQGNPVPDAAVVTDQHANTNLQLAGFRATGASQYSAAHPAFTDASGTAVLRLFPTSQPDTYTFNISPPAGSSSGSTTLPGITVPLSEPIIVTLPAAVPGSTEPTNQPPIANAGQDQVVECTQDNTFIQLDGSGSTDPEGDPLTFMWSGGFLPSPAGGMQPTVSCPSAGSYSITLEVTDTLGATGTDSVNITILDDDSANNGGYPSSKDRVFVGGGGWFHSPEGAYLPDPGADGKLTIAFVVQIPKGETTPQGHTVLHLHKADFAVWVYDFEDLTVAGNLAAYSGIGFDGDQNPYKLVVTLLDGEKAGHGNGKGTDTIRIQIWDQTTTELIYDSQIGSAIDAAPTTPLEGGSIVIN